MSVQTGPYGDKITQENLLGKSHHPKPLIVSNTDRNRKPNCSTLALFTLTIAILCVSLSIIAMTMWILMYRIPYMYVTDGYFYMDSNSFIFFSGLLSIPSCWIAWITYSKKLKQNLLPLLITLLGLSITVLFIGLSMGFVQKTRVLFEQKNKQPELRESIYKSILNETMIGTLGKYDKSFNHQVSWDLVQQRLSCCGVNKAEDWFRYRNFLPRSCFKDRTCTNKKLFTKGCLNLVAWDMAYESCLINAISLILFCLQATALILTCHAYVKAKLTPAQAPVI